MPAHKHDWQATISTKVPRSEGLRYILWACRCGVHEWRDSKEVA